MPSPQGPQFAFAIREAASDVAGMKILGAQPGLPIELDYSLAAGETGGFGGGPYGQFSFGGGTLPLLDQFLTPAQLPSATQWQAGTYLVALNIVAAVGISFTVALYRADMDGNIIEQIGSTPALVTAANASTSEPVLVTFQISAPLIEAAPTDRVLLQVAAKNTDGAAAHTFSFMASQSAVETNIAIPLELGNSDNTFRRNKFLGFFFRPGEGAGYYNEKGISLDTFSLP